MLTRLRAFVFCAAAAALLAPLQAGAQSATPLRLLSESRVWIDGTSSRDDWTVNAESVAGQVVVLGAGEMRIQGGRFIVESTSLVGGRGPIMDRLMHNALKADEHPEIRYELVSVQPAPAGPGKHRLATRGRVTIAGVTQEIEAPAEVERTANGTLRFTGSYALLMSDFGITPPSAMFGALRTGDRVVVNFELLAGPPPS
jgi:polyisoprenoid-binding protein YceI